MSYEGSYMMLDEESEDDVEQQRRQAVERYQTWEGWRDEEVWIADAVQAIIQGNGDYDFYRPLHKGGHGGYRFFLCYKEPMASNYLPTSRRLLYPKL